MRRSLGRREPRRLRLPRIKIVDTGSLGFQVSAPVLTFGLVGFALGGCLALRCNVFSILLACPILLCFGLCLGGLSAQNVVLGLTTSFSLQLGYFAACLLLHFEPNAAGAGAPVSKAAKTRP
jgi:hypothetical protein